MDTIRAFEISITLFFQQLPDWLVVPMRLLSLMGDREFYLLVAPILYWCVDPGIGIRFGLYYMISGCVNFMAKFIMQAPRPFWVDARVIPKIIELTFGVPSGHAQNAVVVFGSLTRDSKLKLSWVWVGLLAFFIGLSRIYMGVHFTSDVLVGWLIGGIILWLALHWEDRFIAWFSKQTINRKYFVALGASLFIMLFGLFLHIVDKDRTLPAEWAANILATTGLEEYESPYSLSNLFSFSGGFLGLALGAVWLFTHGGFLAQAHAFHLVLRYIVGTLGVTLIYLGLSYIFPDGDSALALLFRFIRYAALGLWISAIAPSLFKRIAL